MKVLKGLLAGVFIVLLYAQTVFAVAATTGVTPSKYDVFSGADQMKFVYLDTTNVVATSASETFKIEALGYKGGITEIYFRSSSTNCDVYVSEVDEAAATDSTTIIYITDIDVGYSPELSVSRRYRNRDGTNDKYLYFTISNQGGGATGDWDLIITYERY